MPEEIRRGDRFEGNFFGNVTGNIGSGGTFNQISSPTVIAGVDQMLALLRTAPNLENAGEVLESAEEVKAQTSREQPDVGRIEALLGRIAMAAGSVAGITEAIERVRHALGLQPG